MKGVKRKWTIEKRREEITRRGNQERGEENENRKTVGTSGWTMVGWKKIGKEYWNGRGRREEQYGTGNGKGCSLLCTVYKRYREERGYKRKERIWSEDKEERKGEKNSEGTRED